MEQPQYGSVPMTGRGHFLEMGIDTLLDGNVEIPKAAITAAANYNYKSNIAKRLAKGSDCSGIGPGRSMGTTGGSPAGASLPHQRTAKQHVEKQQRHASYSVGNTANTVIHTRDVSPTALASSIATKDASHLALLHPDPKSSGVSGHPGSLNRSHNVEREASGTNIDRTDKPQSLISPHRARNGHDTGCSSSSTANPSVTKVSNGGNAHNYSNPSGTLMGSLISIFTISPLVFGAIYLVHMMERARQLSLLEELRAALM